MARFTLKPGKTLKELGTAVFELGALKTELDDASETTQRESLNHQINEVQATITDEILDINPSISAGLSSAHINFQYDGFDSDRNQYILNIVVPDLGGKRIDLSESIRDEIDFTDFATECMGHIVIFGCGK